MLLFTSFIFFNSEEKHGMIRHGKLITEDMKRIQLLIGITISAGFLIITLRGIAWNQVVTILQQANYIFLIPGIAIHFLAFWIRSVKWSMITKKFQDVSAAQLFPLVAIGLAMNNILPFRAGEFGRILLLTRKFFLSPVQATLTIVFERLFDILGLLIITLVFVRFRAWPSYIINLLNFTTIFLIVFICIAPLFIKISHIISTAAIIQAIDHIPGVRIIQEKIGELHKGYFVYHDPILVAKVSALSFLLWLLEGLSYYILTFIFHLQIPFPDVIFVCAVVNISSALPSTSGYIGTFEFFATNLLVFLGIPKSLALSFTLILHMELLLPITLVGIYFYFAKHYYTYINLANLTPSQHE